MAIKTMDAEMLKQAFLAGAKNLESNKEWINDLNVFPVPDGDTGTNMTLTILSAVKEVTAIEQPTIARLAKAISSGSLRGARGNSGVILSQLLRGFTREIQDAEEITPEVGARAFQRATETAYKAVMKPKEGTILTVARGMAEKAQEIVAETPEIDLDDLLERVIAHGDEVLANTPELLPVLKQAGVVDSGGQGLMQVVKGCLDGMRGKTVEIAAEAPAAVPRTERVVADTENLGEIRFGYCTEFIINLEKDFDEKTEHDFKGFLESIGDSIVLVADDEIVKVHVHTNDPGQALSRALTYGSLSRMKIDNMREEHEEKLIRDASRIAAEQKAAEEAAKAAKEEPRKPVGFISVSIGEGLAEILSGMNVDCLIEGGQTMNPSTEDMLEAIDQVNADVIYIFPNNKNIILAAEQAAGLVKDKQVVVIPSKSIPQGITALINFSPVRSTEENLEQMTESMEMVKTGEVTYAVRTTTIDDKQIHEGDIMGLGDHSSLLAVGDTVNSVVEDTIAALVDEETELISIYYGQDIREEQASILEETIEERYPDCDVEVHYGGQPIYYYIVSTE
ncbi:MAG: DAK2 domain-containing protein [Lachnospiraceae bacterium]|nr:DAK2 domain-containing protein [Lachnospiraceae bacterium]MCD8124068.1 DAK2 domain-containing protein [Lachnospiraceae bacterium]